MRELTVQEIGEISGADRAGAVLGTIIGGIAGELYGGEIGAAVGAIGGLLGPEVGIPSTAVGAVAGARWGQLVGAAIGEQVGDAIGDFLHNLNNAQGDSGSTFTQQMETNLLAGIQNEAEGPYGQTGLQEYDQTGSMNSVMSDVDAQWGTDWESGYGSTWGGTPTHWSSGSGTGGQSSC